MEFANVDPSESCVLSDRPSRRGC